jgi:hypothetical protein
MRVRLSALFVVWTVPSPWMVAQAFARRFLPYIFRRRPSSLYAFPSHGRRAWFGIGRDIVRYP